MNFLKEQPFQSGLFKMMAIGLGNNDQAVELHAGNYPRRMGALMPAVARQKLVHKDPCCELLKSSLPLILK